MKAFLPLLLLPCFAQVDEVDDLVRVQMKKSDIPGVAVAIFFTIVIVAARRTVLRMPIRIMLHYGEDRMTNHMRLGHKSISV